MLECSCLQLLGYILSVSEAHSTLTTTWESTKHLILPEKENRHSTIQLHASYEKKLAKTEGMLYTGEIKKKNYHKLR